MTRIATSVEPDYGAADDPDLHYYIFVLHEEPVRQLDRIEEKLDRLLKHLGYRDPEEDPPVTEPYWRQ